jgi:hypothetical protein
MKEVRMKETRGEGGRRERKKQRTEVKDRMIRSITESLYT